MTVTSWPRFILFWGAVLAAVVGLVVWLWLIRSSVRAAGELVIAEGSAAGHVWQDAVDHGFSRTTMPWRYHAWRQGASSRLQAGAYVVESGERVANVIRRLASGDTTPQELTITFPEGFTLAQMAARSAARGIGTEESFIAAAAPAAFSDQFPFVRDLPAERTLEGYLFPDTYRVADDDEPADVIRRMLANFDNKFTGDLRTLSAESGRTLEEIVIMASIIEREVIHDEDMAKVAGVLWQRLDDGAGLDADATIRYALGKWDGPLTFDDLQVDSPYNTRRYRGLPPGPISNPGLRAIIAAVRPQTSDFYYYLSTPEGETIFSRTNDEHNANKAKYLR